MKTKFAKSTKPANNKMTAKGREIVASLMEAIELEESGLPPESKFTVRTVEAPKPPDEYDAGRVRKIRDTLGVSQTIFAGLLGVSVILVQSWEQGKRSPAMWARRLLDEVRRDPKHWREMVRRAS